MNSDLGQRNLKNDGNTSDDCDFVQLGDSLGIEKGSRCLVVNVYWWVGGFVLREVDGVSLCKQGKTRGTASLPAGSHKNTTRNSDSMPGMQ